MSAAAGAGVGIFLDEGRCGAVRRVALGSLFILAGACSAGLGLEKGKKGGESASSSSASESGPRGAFELECRGRRMYARLRDKGGAASDSEDEELELSALLDGLVGVSVRIAGLSFCVRSESLRDASRALEAWMAGERASEDGRWPRVGEAFCIWCTVLVEEFLDMRAPGSK